MNVIMRLDVPSRNMEHGTATFNSDDCSPSQDIFSITTLSHKFTWLYNSVSLRVKLGKHCKGIQVHKEENTATWEYGS